MRGLNFRNFTNDIFDQVHDAVVKHRVLVFRATGLDEAGYAALARRIGELDDAKPYSKDGKRHRLSSDKLFDVGNSMADGTIAPLDSQRRASSDESFRQLYVSAQQERYVASVSWLKNGALVKCDDTCVMQKATESSYAETDKRDTRMVTVHDGSSTAWGLSGHSDDRQVFPL